MSHVPDTTAPKLSSLTIPSIVNLSSGRAGLTIDGQATDDISGVKNIVVSFDRNLAYSYALNESYTEKTSFVVNGGVYDSWADGSSSQTWYIADTNSNGSYNITSIKIEDLQGNARTYSTSELKELGVNTSIEFINSTVDTTPPVLNSLVIPNEIDLSSGKAELKISSIATDDLSGVKNIVVWFDKKFAYSYSQNDNYAEHTNLLVNGGVYDSWSDGSSSQSWFIADTNPAGTYNITSIDIQDLQGNIRSYSPTELEKLGINTSVDFVNSKPDTSPPNLKFLKIPTVVDLSSGKAELTIEGIATDDLAGIKNIVVTFNKNLAYSYSSTDTYTENTSFLVNGGVYDSWEDGSSSQTWFVAGTNPSGLYNVTNVLIQDLQGNTRSYAPSELAALGINTTILMVATKSVLTSAGDSFSGSSRADWIVGGHGNDELKGLSGDDMLEGGDGDDILDGGTGADIMIGGQGNDTYYVDWGNDKVIETSSAGGIDTVISSVSRTLGAYQENLVLTGSNAINGTGNNLANTLTGNDADNVLNGGAGADIMAGGLGNDTYYVDWGNDKVIETSANGGIDTIISIVSRTLGDYQENLVLTGTAALYGNGNNLANTLTGNNGDNVLNGGAGADTMIGGLGNDTYYVDWGNDKVIETSANGGIDTVISSVSRTLGDHQENLVLTGTNANYGTGNSLDNTLTGNGADNLLNGGAGNDTLVGGAGNDRLVGGLGKDVLTGGAGNDTFAFNTIKESGLTSTVWDVITDFKRGSDKIDISGIDANTTTNTNEAFNFVLNGTKTFTAAGQLNFVDGILYGNTDSDIEPEFAIQIVGVTYLASSDLIL